MNQILESQQTPHISPSRASYGVYIVRTLEKIDHIITAPHCIVHIQKQFPGLITRKPYQSPLSIGSLIPVSALFNEATYLHSAWHAVFSFGTLSLLSVQHQAMKDYIACNKMINAKFYLQHTIPIAHLNSWAIWEVYCKYRQISNIRCTKSKNLNVSRFVLQLSLCNKSQVLSGEWRCNWSQRCSNYIWVTNNFIAY